MEAQRIDRLRFVRNCAALICTIPIRSLRTEWSQSTNDWATSPRWLLIRRRLFFEKESVRQQVRAISRAGLLEVQPFDTDDVVACDQWSDDIGLSAFRGARVQGNLIHSRNDRSKIFPKVEFIVVNLAGAVAAMPQAPSAKARRRATACAAFRQCPIGVRGHAR